MTNMKGQIQLGESIAVIVIIVILLVFGIAFWGSVNKDDAKASIQESEDLSFVELAKTAAELPELRCYSLEKVVKVNCFDWYKILALNNTMHAKLTKNETFNFYKYYFKTSKITFQQVYPREINVTVYDYNMSMESRSRTMPIYVPVVFERNLGRSGIKTLGWIIIEGYR
jgi:hypothetical protein